MKRNIIYGLLALVLVASCRKKDNPKLPDGMTRLPIPVLVADVTTSTSIDVLNVGNFLGKFSVDMYFKTDIPPSKVDVVVIKNGDKTNIKTFQAAITWPATITVTGANLVSLFGPIKLGDFFDFGADITTQDGVLYQAFPPGTAVGYGTFINSLPPTTPGAPGIQVVIRYGAICAYDPAIYVGPFKANDAFGDADGATIVLTKVSNNQFSFIYPSAINPQPIIVTVNTGTNALTVPLTIIGTQWSPAYGYPNTATYANPSVNSATGSVAPCNKTATLNIQWGTAGGTLQFGGGPYQLLLTHL